MLFSLRAADGSLLYLLKDKKYSVGRKECDILITNDQSISRKHAVITVKDNRVILCDCGAKYKTFIDNIKIDANTDVILKHGNIIRFGMLKSIYTFEETNIVTTTSSIKSDQKVILKSNLNFLGGSFLQNWGSQCTHVTVEQIMLTVKVLCAVITGTPIVNLKYWQDYADRVEENLPPPDVKDYKPSCAEIMLSQSLSLDFKTERRSLFENKIFVFPTKAEKVKMMDLIKLAGGEVISWDTDPVTPAEINNSSSEYVILQSSEASDNKPSDSLLDIISYISQLGKRTIPVQEIALAIINCSCEKDCNPSFDRKGTVLAVKTQTQALKHTENILAHETESQVLVPLEVEQVKTEVIGQSLEHDLDLQLVDSMPHVIAEEPMKNSIPNEEVECISSVKREGELVENPSPTKKIKIDSGPLFTKSNKEKNVKNSSEINIESARDSGELGKSLFAFKNVTSLNENTNSETKSVVINPFAKKRRIVQSDEDENPPKRSTPDVESSVKSSAFTSPFTTTSNKNPFANILKSRKSTPEDQLRNSQFPTTSKQKSPPKRFQPNILSSTAINDNVSSLQVDLSAIEPVDSGLDNTYGWISKTSCSGQTVSKQSPKTNGFSEGMNEVDEELKKYIESFRNVVVIEEESMVVRKPTVINNNDSSITDNNLKNFKKFKKVSPLKIQTTIIPESKYVNIVCNEKSAIQTVESDSESEKENDDIDSQAKSRKSRGKRFQF